VVVLLVVSVWQPARAASRDSAGQLRILDAQADGLVFTTSGPLFRRRLRILNQGDAPAKDVTVNVPDFENAAGERFPASGDWKGKTTASLKADQILDITIEANLTSDGDYFTYVDLHAGSRLVSTRLEVSRADRDLGIEAVVPTVAEIIRWPWDTGLATSISLQETSGVEQHLGAPILWSLSIKEAEARRTDEVAELELVSVPPGGVPPGDIRVPSRGKAEVPIRLSHLGGPGRYEGSLRFQAQGRKPADVAFAIVAKEELGMALGLIVLGVLTSWVVRWYVVSGRKTLAWRAELARIVDELRKVIAGQQPLVAREIEVERRLDERADDLSAKLEAGRTDHMEESLKRLRRCVQLLDELARRERELAGLPAELGDDVRNTLDHVAGILSQPDPPLAALAGARKKLDVNLAELDRGSLRQAIQALIKEADDARATTSQVLVARLNAEVTERLNTATSKLREDHRQDARRSLEEARLAFAKILAEDLRAKIPTTEPPGIDRAGWDALRKGTLDGLNEVASATDADAAAANFGHVRARLIAQRFAGLTKAARQLRGKVKDNPALTKEARAGIEERIDKLMAKIEADAALDARAALRAYDGALADWKQLDDDATAMGAADKQVAASMPTLVPGAEAWAVSIPAGPQPPPAAVATKLEAKIKRNDRAVAGALLVVAVLTGVKTVWLKDATWGGPRGYLIAFLWGWGVDAIGKLSIDGLLELRARAFKAD
jgi:hypothetical protein